MLEPSLRQAAQYMRWELEGSRLEVVLVPSERPEIALRGGKIRRVAHRNPSWYRQLCAAYPSHRRRPRRRQKPDTRIKRSCTLRALREIEQGRAASEYARRLLPWVQDYADEVERLMRILQHQPEFMPQRPFNGMALNFI